MALTKVTRERCLFHKELDGVMGYEVLMGWPAVEQQMGVSGEGL